MTTTTPKADIAEIRRGLAAYAAANQVIEVRALKTRWKTCSGFFDDHEKCALAIAGLSGDVSAVYITPNPLTPALLARANNRIARNASSTAADRDVIERRWLLIDCDPTRPTQISSSDEEHEGVIDRARMIRDYLDDEGWLGGLLVDSGNGAHLSYPIRLANNPASLELISQCLAALAAMFNDALVEVDRTSCNAARIWKAPGTLAKKGDDIPERPHRMAKILDDQLEGIVSTRQLEELAAQAPEQSKPPSQEYRGKGQFNLDQWIVHHGLVALDDRPWLVGGRRIRLEQCGFDGNHGPGDAVITVNAGGGIGYKCHHHSCFGKTWRDLRAHLEPGAYDRRNSVGGFKEQARQSEQSGNGYSEDRPPEYRLRVLDVANVEPKPVTWLWPQRFTVGKFCLLAGDPGLGKSYASLDIAARVSVGGPWPDQGHAPRGNVLISSVEDGTADTIRPRLDLLEADLSCIRIIEAIVESEAGSKALSLVDHLQLLEDEIRSFDATLLILDPILAFTGTKDTHRASDCVQY